MSTLQDWDGTEAQALDDQSDYGAADDFEAQESEERYRLMRALYDTARATKTGAQMRCPGCGMSILKKTYNKVFCSNGRTTKGRSSCKDVYWNTVNPRGLAAEED